MQQVHRSIAPEVTWTSIAELPRRGRRRLRLRDVRPIGPGARNGRGAQRRLPGVRVAHAMASGVGRGRRRVGEPDVLTPRAQIGEQMLTALVRAEAAPIRRLAPAPSLEAARDAVERLLASWDDDLAAETFSMNVDMDEPIEHRRAAIERLRETHGSLRRSDEAPTCDTPLHAAWWLEGEPGRGRVKVEITLDPQPVPKVQWMELTSVPEPDPRLRAAAEALVGSVERRDRASSETPSWCARCSVGARSALRPPPTPRARRSAWSPSGARSTWPCRSTPMAGSAARGGPPAPSAHRSSTCADARRVPRSTCQPSDQVIVTLTEPKYGSIGAGSIPPPPPDDPGDDPDVPDAVPIIG